MLYDRFKGMADDRGVSVMVGAMLLFAMLAMAFVIVQSSYQPVWEKEAETRHMTEVQKEWGSLQSSLSRQATGAGALSHAIPLKPPKRDFLPDSQTAHTISFTPGENPIEVLIPRLAQPIPFGALPPSPGAGIEVWEEITKESGDCGIKEVPGTIWNLRLRIDELGSKDFNAISVYATEPSGSRASFVVKEFSEPPNKRVQYEVQDGATTVYTNPGAFHISSDVNPYWVNLLEPEYQFEKFFRRHATGGGFTLYACPGKFASLEDALDGPPDEPPKCEGKAEDAMAIPGCWGPLTGSVTVSGGSTTDDDECVDDFEKCMFSAPIEICLHPDPPDPDDCDRLTGGGTLRYHGENYQFVEQEYILENGLYVLQQRDGWVTKIAPRFAAEQDADKPWRTIVSIDIPLLVGPPTMIGGPEVATVNLVPVDSYLTNGLTDRFEIIVTSSYPQAWAEAWERTLEDAGLVDPTKPAMFSILVNEEAGTAKLTLEGTTVEPSPDPDDVTYDIGLTLRIVAIQVELAA